MRSFRAQWSSILYGLHLTSSNEDHGCRGYSANVSSSIWISPSCFVHLPPPAHCLDSMKTINCSAVVSEPPLHFSVHILMWIHIITFKQIKTIHGTCELREPVPDTSDRKNGVASLNCSTHMIFRRILSGIEITVSNTTSTPISTYILRG